MEFLLKTEVEFLLTSEVEFLSSQGRSRRAVALKNWDIILNFLVVPKAF